MPLNGKKFQQMTKHKKRVPISSYDYIHVNDLHSVVATKAPQITGRVLDYGSGTRPHAELFRHVDVYHGADFPDSQHRVDIPLNVDGTLPVEADQYDAVLSFQVLEHIENVKLYLDECYRVLRPGGVLMLTAPGIWSYHPCPKDLRRWVHDGLRYEMMFSGFTNIEVTPATWGIRALLQLTVMLLRDKPLRGKRFLIYIANWLADRFAQKPVTDSAWYQLPIAYLCLGYKEQ